METCPCRESTITYTYGGEQRTAVVYTACAEHRATVRGKLTRIAAYRENLRKLVTNILPAPERTVLQ